MAKCKDCGEKTGFLASRCAPCSELFEKANAEEIERDYQANLDLRESEAYEKAKQALYFYEDKFVDKSQYSSEEFSLKHPRGFGFTGNLKMYWTAMNDGTFWLTATQRMKDWEWIYDNTTIVLMPGGKKFVQDNIDLRAHDTQTAGYDVICIETHIVNVTTIIKDIRDFYHENRLNQECQIDARIGQTEFSLNLERLRLAAALYDRMKEKR